MKKLWKKVNSQTRRQDSLVLLLVLALLLITPINTDISYVHMAYMGLTLSLAIYLPYLIYRNNKSARIHYPLKLRSGWTKQKLAYILLAGVIGYLLFPFYFATTEAYINWPGPSDPLGIFLLFLGTNALGIWDELFFVITLLGIFQRYMSFWYANILQSIFWVIFLFELGFVGWILPLIFVFALTQGYTYKLFHSLGFLIAVHLTIDFMLFLAILDAHQVLPINI